MVEAYIEAILSWSSCMGMESARLSPLQRLVWSLPIAGQFFEGMNPLMGGIALPLLKAEFVVAHGSMASATLAGSC